MEVRHYVCRGTVVCLHLHDIMQVHRLCTAAVKAQAMFTQERQLLSSLSDGHLPSSEPSPPTTSYGSQPVTCSSIRQRSAGVHAPMLWSSARLQPVRQHCHQPWQARWLSTSACSSASASEPPSSKDESSAVTPAEGDVPPVLTLTLAEALGRLVDTAVDLVGNNRYGKTR